LKIELHVIRLPRSGSVPGPGVCAIPLPRLPRIRFCRMTLPPALWIRIP